MNTSSFTYKSPKKLLEGINDAIEDVRKNNPHFLIVDCYRWMEHVGVGFDWDLGYRNKKELDFWKEFDIETNPELWSFSKEDVDVINIKVKQRVENIFREAYSKEDSPRDSLLKNVY